MNNNIIKSTVEFVADLPQSIEVRKKDGRCGAYLPKSQILTDRQYSEIREGEKLDIAAPKWLLETQGLV